MDIDPEIIDKNPFDHVDPSGGDEDGDELIPMTSTTIGGGAFHNHGMDETSFIHHEGLPQVDESTSLIQRESMIDDAWDRIRQKYPKVNPANFTATIDEFDQVIVKLKRMGGKSRPLFNQNGEINDKLPKKIVDGLGPPAEDIIATNEEHISELEGRRENVAGASLSEVEQEAINREIEQLDRENEVIEERMSLKDRVKAIFKKYGFTVFSVVSAVGIVIGVIVSSLKNGLSNVAKGVGNGLKTIGKKLGEILPGMVGAIVSFLFKTAGEVVGFLAKNAWLLIVAVLLYFVEQFKKKK